MLNNFKQIRQLSDSLTEREWCAKAIVDVNDTMTKVGEGITRLNNMYTDGYASEDLFDSTTGLIKPITRLTDSGTIYSISGSNNKTNHQLNVTFETWADVFEFMLNDGSWALAFQRAYTPSITIDVIYQLMADEHWYDPELSTLTNDQIADVSAVLNRIIPGNTLATDPTDAMWRTRKGYVITTSGGNGSSIVVSWVYYCKTNLYPSVYGGQAIIYSNPDAADWFNEQLDALTTNYGAQHVLSVAMEACASGNATASELAARLNTNYSSYSSNLRSLIDQLVACGSSDTASAAHSLKTTYRSMSAGSVVDDGHIEWGEVNTPKIDYSIGTVFLDVILTAGQVLGSILAFSGAIISKLAGVAITLASTGINAILKAEADAMNTYPEINTDTIDQLIGYPIISNGNYTFSASEYSQLQTSIKEQLETYGCCKVVNPFAVMFLYNFGEKGERNCDVKLFLNASIRGKDSVVPSLHAINSDGSLNSDFYNGGSYFDFNINFRRVGGASGAPYCLNDARIDRRSIKSSTNSFGSGYVNFGPMGKLSAAELAGEGKSADDASYGNIYLTILASMAYCKLLTVLYDDNLTDSQYDLKLHDINGRVVSWEYFLTGYDDVEYRESYAYDNAIELTKQGYTVGTSTLYGWFSPIEFLILLNMFEVSSGGPSYVILTDDLINNTVKYRSGHDDYEYIISTLLKDFAKFTFESEIVVALCSTSMSTGCRWLGVDQNYCIKLPERSWKSVVLAQILIIAAIAGTMLATVAVKRLIRRKAQPWVQRNINSLEDERDKVRGMKKGPKETKEHFEARKSKAINSLYRRARKFNLKCRILGMGSFDVAAGFWDGSTVVGGSFDASPASIGDGQDLEESSPLGVIRQSIASNQQTIEEADSQIKDITDKSDQIITLLK